MMCFASVDALFAPEIFSRLLSFCGLFLETHTRSDSEAETPGQKREPGQKVKARPE